MSALFYFYFGAILGSYFQSLNSRMAKDQNLNYSNLNTESRRSNCDICGNDLQIFELIPIISFLFLKGRCRHCNQKISIEHLTSELLFGLIVLSLSFNASLDLNFASSILFFCLLFAIALFDLKFFLIPKNYLFVLILTSCVFALVNEYVVNFIFALFFTLSIWLMKYILDHVKKEETFGLGDVFIIFALGCYFEPILFSLIILTSALSGLVIFTIRFIFSNPEKKLPFGTLMALSAFSIEVLV